MDAFLTLVVRGRAQAVLVATLCLLLPLTSFLSGGIVGLVTLRYGLADGAFVLLASTATASALVWLLFGELHSVLSFAAVIGLPVLLLAATLRFSGSQGVMLMAVGAAAALVTTVVHLGVGDSALWWRDLLERFVLDRLRLMEPAPDVIALERFSLLLDALSPWMTVVFMLRALLILYLARWCHARLDNPGGFGREFRELRYDRRLAVVAMVLAALATFAPGWASGLIPMLLQLVLVLYVVQGLAIAHGLAAGRRAGGWLTAIYLGLLFVTPLVAVPLAATGFSDTWIDYRRRYARGSS